MRTRIKVCGVRTIDAARAAADAGADAIGFMFAPGSPRTIDPAAAAEIMCRLPPFLSTVAVFQNVSFEAFCDAEERCPTTMVQFHGQEPADLVRDCGPGLIKAVRFDEASISADLSRWSALDEVDAILVDGSAGGRGVAFDWSRLAPLVPATPRPIIVAGGLNPANVAGAVRACRPFAVDVSSGVESAPGDKSPALIAAFCDAVRRADLG